MKQKMKGIACLLVLSGIMIFLVVLAGKLETKEDIMINEVCSNNFNIIEDDSGKYSDYVELWNTTQAPLTLEHYYLSDDKEDLKKYSLSNVQVPENGYFLLFLNREESEKTRSKSFKLSKNGEWLYLYDDSKDKVVQSVEIPKLTYNKVYARVEDGLNQWSVMQPTPGNSNNGSKLYPLEVLESPRFSLTSGFYDEEFDLTLQAPSGDKIYYTLDGSEPTKDSILYEGLIHVTDASQNENVYAARTDLSPTKDYVPDFLLDKATVVKAFVYNEKMDTCSPIVSRTYFVGFNDKHEYDNMSIISLVVNPDYLFDEEIGIYANGKKMKDFREKGGLLEDGTLIESYEDEDGNTQNLYEASNAFYTGRAWEREANVTYFDEAHDYRFAQEVGIRIAGASTRGTPEKSFKLYGRDIYDEQVEFPYTFFDNTVYSSIKLRNGGGNNASMKMTDAFVESLVEDRDVAIQRAKPTVLFLNGEYWGLYNIRERFTAEYVHNYYNVDSDNVWIIDAETSQEGGQEALDEYFAMKAAIEDSDLSNDEVYEAMTAPIDMQSLMDFLCFNLFVGNTDIDFNQNTALWRTIEQDEGIYGDCKWRFMVFDVDECMDAYDLEESRGWIEDFALFQTPFVQRLLQNEGFRRQLFSTMVDMMNTDLDYDTIHEKLMEWKTIYKTQNVKTIQRFFRMDYTEETFDEKIERMDRFFEHREEFILQELKSAYGLSDLPADERN